MPRKRGAEERRPNLRWARPTGLPAKTPDGERLVWTALDYPRMAFGFVDRAGRLVWTSFAYLGDRRQELTSDELRALNIARTADYARQALAAQLAAKHAKSPKRHGAAATKAAKSLEKPHTGGKRLEDAELREIARLYREGLRARPRAPLAYVQAALGRTKDGELRYKHRSTVKRRVDNARAAGYLGMMEGR